MTVAAAITILAAAALLSMSCGTRLFAARSAVQQFDAALAYAQALASAGGDGATIVFSQRKTGDGAVTDGFVLTVYSGRPTSANALQPASIPPLISVGDVAESKLGAPPFSVFLNASGHAGAARGAVSAGSVLASDPGCPPGEAGVTLVFRDPRAAVTRSIACNAVP